MEKTVIIPALDPDETLVSVIDGNLDLGHQVIVVDDGSAPEYDQMFWELGEKCIVLHHRENLGKGEAIKTALKYIKKELWQCSVIGIMDADGQHLPEDMEKLLIKAESHPNALILGSRVIDGAVPWRSRMGNQITRQVFRLLTGKYVSDTQTGLRALTPELLDFMLEIGGSRYEYEMGVLTACAKQNVEIIEVPVHTIYHDKDNSCSHFRRVRDSVRIYRQLLKFSASSFSSFLLDYALFVLLTFILSGTALGVGIANVTARAVSAVYNYLMNCHFVFREKENIRSAADYLLLASGILVLNSLVLQEFLLLHIPPYPAKILTECILFLVSWNVQKKVIFRTGGTRTAARGAELTEGGGRI